MEGGVIAPRFSPTALDGGKWSASHSGRFGYPGVTGKIISKWILKK